MPLKTKRNILNGLDYFIGGVPAYQLFKVELTHLNRIVVVAGDAWQDGSPYLYSTHQLCFIGLASYFEAFCKNLFASLINIHPELLDGLCKRRGDIEVPVLEVYRLNQTFRHRIGSVVAQKFDFGISKSINSAYLDLIQVTPFSKDEAHWFSQFVNDRNLLVHHGGTFTFKYAGQRFKAQSIEDIHFQSLVIEKKHFLDCSAILQQVALKMNSACAGKLKSIVKNGQVKLASAQKRALWFLDWID